MNLKRLVTDSGRATYINIEQIITVGQDPMNEARTEIVTAEGIFHSKKSVELVLAILADPKAKEI